jgi:hypothetical protein
MNINNFNFDDEDNLNLIVNQIISNTLSTSSRYTNTNDEDDLFYNSSIRFSPYTTLFGNGLLFRETDYERVLNESFNEHMQNSNLKKDDEKKLNYDIILYKKLSRKVKKENVSCSVCFENYEKEDEVCYLKCQHLFHYNCINEWYKYKETCPICRINL